MGLFQKQEGLGNVSSSLPIPLQNPQASCPGRSLLRVCRPHLLREGLWEGPQLSCFPLELPWLSPSQST